MTATDTPAVEEPEEGTFPFTLDFTVDECEGCGKQRSVEAECPECNIGDIADEGPVADRRSATGPALAALDEPATAAEGPSAPRAWFPVLGDWLTSFLTALADFVSERSGVEPLEAACRDLSQIEADLAAVAKYRPELAGWRAVSDTTRHCRLIAKRYLDCTREPTLAGAREYGDKAQMSMSAVGPLIEQWTELHEGWFGDDDTAPTDLVARGAVIGARFVGADADGLLDADARGQWRYEQITGSTACPGGMGLSMALIDAQVTATMDCDRFWTNVSWAYRLLTGPEAKGCQKFGQVISAPGWVADMVEVQTQLVEAIRDMPANIDGSNGRQLARTLVRLGHLNCERAAKYLVATVLCAFRDRDYASKRTQDFGALVGEAGDLHLGDLIEGIDKAMRHGDAHREYTVTDDGVQFTAERREYDFLTWDELLDRVILGLESTLAIHTAILCAATEAGLDAEDLVDFAALFTPQDALAMVAAADGWSGVEITIEDGEVTVEAIVQRPVTFAIIGAFSAHLPAEIQALTIRTRHEGQLCEMAGPLDPMRTFSSQDPGVAKQAAFLDIVRTWTVDGLPVTDSVGIRKAVSCGAFAAADDDSIEMAHRTKAIRPWLDAGRRAGDDELAAAVAQVLAGVRAMGMGKRAVPGFNPSLTKIVAWSNADAEWRMPS